MTPSHHGLGSVVLCTAGAHTVAVDMRHVAGTGRVGRDRDHVVDLATGLGLAATEFERVLHLQTPAGRVSLGVEKVSQPFDTTERIPLSALAGAETARHFEAMAQVNGQWYLVLDVRPFTGGSAHAAEEQPAAAKAPGAARRPRRAAPGRAWPAAPRSAIWSCSRPRRRRSEAHPLAYALSAAQVVEVTFVPDIAPMPLAPPHVRGLCDWRGRPLLVVDLPARLMTDCRRTTAPRAAHRLPPRQLARPVRRARRVGHPDGAPAHRPRADRA